MRVYVVKHKTWTCNDIVGIYKTKERANKCCETMERAKKYSDGYLEYYVYEYEVEE